MGSPHSAESERHEFASIPISSYHVSLGESCHLSELQCPFHTGMKPFFSGF